MIQYRFDCLSEWVDYVRPIYYKHTWHGYIVFVNNEPCFIYNNDDRLSYDWITKKDWPNFEFRIV